MPNFAAFNELSLEPLIENQHRAKELLEGLVKLFRRLAPLGIRRLRTRHEFRYNHITQSLTIQDIIGVLAEDDRRLALTILDSPYAEGVEEELLLPLTLHGINGDKTSWAEGILSALCLNTLAVSLASTQRWMCVDLQIDVEDSEQKRRGIHGVRHASEEEHAYAHLLWCSRNALNRVPPSPTRPLPNTNISDMLVRNTWSDFYDRLKSMHNSEKNAAIYEMGRSVAEINWYELEPDLTKINQKRSGKLRQIFASGQVGARTTIYLSIDFEKAAGAFEVLDHQGMHLGEWLFNGKMNKKADSSGSHNIMLRAV